MNAKHQFKYTYNNSNLEEFSPIEVTFDMPGDVNITQMLYNFESYLKACGFIFDGHLELINNDCHDGPNECDCDCMSDWDSVATSTSSACDEYDVTAEVEKNEWIHGMCNPPAKKAKDCKLTGKRYKSVSDMVKDFKKLFNKDTNNCCNS